MNPYDPQPISRRLFGPSTPMQQTTRPLEQPPVQDTISTYPRQDIYPARQGMDAFASIPHAQPPIRRDDQPPTDLGVGDSFDKSMDAAMGFMPYGMGTVGGAGSRLMLSKYFRDAADKLKINMEAVSAIGGPQRVVDYMNKLAQQGLKPREIGEMAAQRVKHAFDELSAQRTKAATTRPPSTAGSPFDDALSNPYLTYQDKLGLTDERMGLKAGLSARRLREEVTERFPDEEVESTIREYLRRWGSTAEPVPPPKPASPAAAPVQKTGSPFSDDDVEWIFKDPAAVMEKMSSGKKITSKDIEYIVDPGGKKYKGLNKIRNRLKVLNYKLSHPEMGDK